MHTLDDFTDVENELMKNKIKKADRMGFPITLDLLESTMAQIAADGRNRFKNRLPSDDSLIEWRTRNRNVDFGKHRCVDVIRSRRSEGH